jgi:hypothetical protein
MGTSMTCRFPDAGAKEIGSFQQPPMRHSWGLSSLSLWHEGDRILSAPQRGLHSLANARLLGLSKQSHGRVVVSNALDLSDHIAASDQVVFRIVVRVSHEF